MAAPHIIDVRDLLPHRDEGGEPGTFSPKQGIIIHYSGPKVDRDADTLTVLASYADYHMGPYLRERGIAYHYDVGNDAAIRLLRDPAEKLWHCGSWPENATNYAVHVMIGGDQRATDAQLASLTVLVDWLRARDGISRSAVKGHQEVSSTDCPGTLMEWVYAYRDGKDRMGKLMADGQYFNATGHYVGGGFYRFWQGHGGLSIFGYPLTEERQEPDESGKQRVCQWFERARFEYWPEDEAQPVKLSRLGAEALAHQPA